MKMRENQLCDPSRGGIVPVGAYYHCSGEHRHRTSRGEYWRYFPVYPQLTRIPGYPVYYAPHSVQIIFFYDGMYWVYQGDNWYASSWYNGPWEFVEPAAVPSVRPARPGALLPGAACVLPRLAARMRRHAGDDHWGNDWAQERQRVGQVEP